MEKQFDRLEVISLWVTRFVFVLGLIVFLAAPLLAISWSNQPFPGFLTEHTLLVNGVTGEGWTGAQAGIGFPERVIRISGVQILYPQMLSEILTQKESGDPVTFFTEFEDGSKRLYPSVILMEFPREDFIRLFWIPYFIGLVYYLIGVWVFVVRGRDTRPGRALAFFCVCTALATALIFDLYTTHRFVPIWVASIATAGGALFSLGMRFPVEWRIVKRFPWFLGIPYITSIALIAWGWVIIFMPPTPWAYVDTWGVIYRYNALGIFFFLGLAFYHAWTSESDLIRSQSRIVLAGGILAFLPITFFFIAPIFNAQVLFNSLIFLPPLILFPLSVTVAITRYRLLEMDHIVNRTVVYGTLTAIVGGLFTALVLLMRYFFVVTTGEKNDIALVITTFVVASLFNPIKDRVQKFVDRQFKHPVEEMIELKRFGSRVNEYLLFLDVEEISRKFLEETVSSLGVRSAQLTISPGNQPGIIHTFGKWNGTILSSIPIEYKGISLGMLLLGPRKNNQPYSQKDVALVQKISQSVAQVMIRSAQSVQMDQTSQLDHSTNINWQENGSSGGKRILSLGKKFTSGS